MATTKTLTPTNQAITLAAFTEKPDNRTNVTNDDKLADAVNTLNSNFASLSSRSIGIPYTIPANGQWNTNLYTFINQDLPSGYEVLGIVGLTTNETNVYAVSYQYYNGNYSFQIKNTSSAEITGNATVRYLCVKRN